MPELKADLDVLRDVLRGRALNQLPDEPLGVQLTHPIRIASISFTPTTALSIRTSIREESACVKYALSAKASGRLPFTSGSSEVEFTDYRKHRATDSAWQALRDDLAAPRSLLELDDVRKLQPGDAVAMEIGGTLSATVSFSWADAISAKLHELTELPVVLKLKRGLEASARVRVKDRFMVMISRTREHRYRIAIQKARSHDHTFSIDVSLGAEANAMGAVDEVLDAIQVDSLRKELRERLEKIARWKAATGFAYEYARIDENTSIVDYVLLDDALLAEDHARAIAGEFGLREDTSARSIVRYLNETTHTRKSSSGFSFGLVAAKDESTFKQTTRTSLDGFHLITSRGTRKYDEKHIPQNDFEWTVDLKAQMTEFLEKPSTLDFDYGLQYVVTLERNKFSEDDLARVLDFAAMWDICAPPVDEFAEVLHHKATARIQLTFEREQLRLLSSRSVARDLGGWGAPLAMAMPYMTTFPARRTFEKRRDAYTPAWSAWLDGQKVRLRGFFEERALPGSFAWISGIGHPQLRERLESFMRGAQKLHDVMTSAHKPEEIGVAYQALERFWSQRLYIAASGRWLLDRARDAGVEPARALQIQSDAITALTSATTSRTSPPSDSHK